MDLTTEGPDLRKRGHLFKIQPATDGGHGQDRRIDG